MRGRRATLSKAKPLTSSVHVSPFAVFVMLVISPIRERAASFVARLRECRRGSSSSPRLLIYSSRFGVRVPCRVLVLCCVLLFCFVSSRQLLIERDGATGELHNIVRVSSSSKLRLQLPEKARERARVCNRLWFPCSPLSLAAAAAAAA